MQLEDWLDDLCARFIINLPHEELGSVERICFQIEEAQWFYEDFIRPLDPALPSLPLRNFSLLIFQHCPLFAGFPQEFFSEAFSQFLAYKTRVPVRGAIMLNEDMDHVVLVKGWKKNANWSFPRGKINKDEKDLDCAIREVYEETGFDIKAAGLVLDESEMKYISVTIREQDVGLYVFRGVPMDTHFEPRTRKEISKIEWYKLSDLPTFKKNKHHESNGESLAINANKFYMVAPFLHELRRWIAQQRKRDAIEGRHRTTRPSYEEVVTATEDEQDMVDLHPVARAYAAMSDLPEVTVQARTIHDPSAHLKALLNINPMMPSMPQASPVSPPSAEADREKSNALLNLLRNGTTFGIGQSSDRPYTPEEYMIANQKNAPSPLHSRPVTHEISELSTSTVHATTSQFRNTTINGQQPPPAQYRMTGDSAFPRPPGTAIQGINVPPASSLPKLSDHARTLLDAFKAPASVPSPVQSTVAVEAGAMPPRHAPNGFEIQQSSTLPPGMFNTKPQGQHRNDLLGLFKNSSTQPSRPMEQATTRNLTAPVELSAHSTPSASKVELPQKDLLMNLFQQKKTEQPTPTMSNAQRASPQIRILQRPTQDVNRASEMQAPIRAPEPKATTEPPKPFQPQILRRPTDNQQQIRPTHEITAPAANSTISFDRRTSQTEVHKKALLSLFNKSSPGLVDQSRINSGQLTPALAPSPSGLVSPMDERQESALETDVEITPVARSRMGSASSFGGGLTPSSTKTTNPSDRAFLLQYLGVAKGGS